MNGMFVNRESGARARVTEVTDSHAILAIDNPKGLPSRFSMPIAEYDGAPEVPEGRRFSSLWRPATAADEDDRPLPGFRPPANMGGDPEAPAAPQPAYDVSDREHEANGVTFADND